MKTEIKHQIKDLINGWVEPGNDSRSQAKLAARIGISTANVSLIKRGKFDSIGQEIWNKAAAFFEVKGAAQAWRHFDTPNYIAIQEVLKNAQTLQRRAAIDGGSGWGKTYAIKKYCNTPGNEEAVHIICRRSMNPKKFVQAIAQQLNISSVSSNRYDIEEAIAAKLLKMNKPLLVFDETENLSLTCFSSIKAIIDLTDGHCGIVLVGIEIFQMIEKYAFKGKDAFRQLRRRFPVQAYEFLSEIDKSQMTGILADVGIADRGAHEWFCENIADYDALANTVNDALRIAKATRREIDRPFMAEYFGDKRMRWAS